MNYFNIFKNSFNVFFLLIIFTFYLFSCKKKENEIDFNMKIPKYISSIKGNISINKTHFLSRSHSLKWDYTPNDILIIKKKIPYKPREISKTITIEGKKYFEYSNPFSFKMWVLNENEKKESESRFKVEIGKKNKVHCWFYFYPTRKGWTPIETIYSWLMRGKAVKNMEWVKIIPPQNSGTIYIDNIEIYKSVHPVSYQNYFSHPERRGANGVRSVTSPIGEMYYTNPAKYYSKPLNEPIEIAKKSVKEEEIKSFKIIVNRLLPMIKEKSNTKVFNEKEMESYRKKYESFGLVVLKGEINSTNENHLSFKSSRFSSKYTKNYCKAMRTLGSAYMTTSNLEQKSILSLYVINMYKHAKKVGVIPSPWYNGRGFVEGLFYIKKDLKKQGLLNEAIKYAKVKYNFSKYYDLYEQSGIKNKAGDDTDYMYTCSKSILLSILMMDNTPEKVRDMRYFSKYASDIQLNYGPGISDGLKRDGTVFHHSTDTPKGYGNYTIKTFYANTIYPLSGTVFRISKEAHKRAKQTSIRRAFFKTQNYFPVSFGDIKLELDRKDTSFEEFKYLALSGTPNADSKIDHLMGSYYLSTVLNNPIYENKDKKKVMNQFLSLGIKPLSNNLEGHKTYPYGAYGIHRRNDWMVSIAGHSRYIYGRESWGVGIPAMYLRYGWLEINYPDRKGLKQINNGFRINGWDWNRIPGATTVYRDHNRLKPIMVLKGHAKDEHLFSDQAFVGGVNLSGKDGLFTMKVRGHDKYKLDSFYATKSWLFVDDLIICVGSDIYHDIESEPVETTLFQNTIENIDNSLYINKNKINQFPYEEEISNKEAISIFDNRSNGYYIPAGQKVNFARKEQIASYTLVKGRNYSSKSTNKSFGKYNTAYISHGIRPQRSQYQYAIKIKNSLNDFNLFKKRMLSSNPVFVIQQLDRRAHIIKHLDKKISTYSIFEKDFHLKDNLLAVVSKPAMIMIKEEGDNLRLSISDPDLRLYEGYGEDVNIDLSRTEYTAYSERWYYNDSKSSVIFLKLKKKYSSMKTLKGNATVLPDKSSLTTLKFICGHGETSEIILEK